MLTFQVRIMSFFVFNILPWKHFFINLSFHLNFFFYWQEWASIKYNYTLSLKS